MTGFNLFQRRKDMMTLTPRSYLDMARALPAFQRLVQDTDRDCAELTVATLWAAENKRTFTNDLTKIVTARSNEQYYRNQLSGRLDMERQRVLASTRYLDMLLLEAYSNVFVTLRNTPGHQIPPDQYGARQTDTDLIKASKWVCTSSNSFGRTANRADVTAVQRAITTVLNRNMDLRHVETIEHIHRAVVGSIPANADALRNTPMGQNYCGVGGGTYLQAYAARQSRKIREMMPLPPAAEQQRHRYETPGQRHYIFVPTVQNQHNNWGNIACYLLGAHLRAHAFTDGNGRAVRTLFACAIIKSNADFIAPTYAFEKQLSGL